MCLDIELLDGSGDLDLIVKEERRSGFYPDEKEATFVEANLPPLHITPFAIDGAGGYYAFWRRPNEELENAPVIVWDSEGTIGLMAPSLDKYLALLAALNAGKCALHTAIAEESVEFPKELLGKKAGEEGITDGMYSATFEEAIDVEGRKYVARHSVSFSLPFTATLAIAISAHSQSCSPSNYSLNGPS